MNPYAHPDKLASLKAKANRLPLTPGVYIMKDPGGVIIYIGKAKALKNRVTQYFGSGSGHTEKVRRMVASVDDFDVILCDSEFEALILENSLIKQNQPKYNILLKDDKGYAYIRVSDEKWKRLTAEKTTDQKGEYFGPYNSFSIVRETVDEACKVFKLPNCNRDFDHISKPCLNYHIGICNAPCRGKISLSSYLESVDEALDFIRHGDENGQLLGVMRKKMEAAAQNLEFETAAALRDRIRAIEKIRQRQKVVRTTYRSEDVIASAFIGETACVEVILFRNHRLIDKVSFRIDGVFDREQLYAEFLSRYYADRNDLPQRVLIDREADYSSLETWLSQKAGRKVVFLTPKQGEQKQLLDLCFKNAAENLSERANRTGREMSVLNELASLLGLHNPPRRIESFDISHTAGSENVAGMVVYRDGRPYKPAYRKFRIKGFTGQDDYRSMAEVVERRLQEYEKGEDEEFSKLPDLILLDGGQGQTSAVQSVLEAHGISVPVFGMVKDSKHRTRAIAAKGGDIAIRSNRAVFTFVTGIQDEVHRFAIGYHRNRRKQEMLNSELTTIPGIGKTRAKALISSLKTIKAVREASVEELAAVPGMTRPAAERVYEVFHDQ